jgi:hypothetical protein
MSLWILKGRPVESQVKGREQEIPAAAKEKFNRAYDNVSDKNLPGDMSSSEAVRRGTVAFVNMTALRQVRPAEADWQCRAVRPIAD